MKVGGKKKTERKKRENGRDDDEDGCRLAVSEKGKLRPGYARRGRNRAGTKKIRRKAGLIRALVAPPPPPTPPELIDCMESTMEREREREMRASCFSIVTHAARDTALARFLPTDKLASARLPRVINRRIAFVLE